jgi:serine/threonine protein kinase
MPFDAKRVKEIFLEAAELSDEAARAAHLDRACGRDAGLRAQVEALLRSHDPQGSFLATPAAVVPDPDHAGAATITVTMPTESHSPANDKAPLGSIGPATLAATTTSVCHSPVNDELPLGFLGPATRPDSLGRIGHYEVLQVLGQGGFGIVFRAFDDVLHRVVAVKVLSPQMAATSPARKRFLREARSSAQVRHENVVQVYEVGEQPLPYIAMESIPGETLQQRLDRSGPLDVVEVVRVGRQVAEGLAAAHATDLIHRDIKPGNILLEGGAQRVKITDFGLARAADDASISQSGIIAGTPMYMAPEQAKGEKLDQRADLFSLGSVLYQMAAGRPPFRANSTVAVLKRVAEDTPRDIREIIPETPQWLCDIIAKLHAKKPEDRFQSAREVADVLADCEAQLKANSKLKDFSRIPRGKPRRSGRQEWPIVAAVLVPVIVLLAMKFAGVFRGRPGTSGTNSGSASAANSLMKVSEGWVPLFNGKDLTGWKTHPNQFGDWNVSSGVIVGKGPQTSYLFTERNDFENFHLRAELKVGNPSDAGLFFRSGFALHKQQFPLGYETNVVGLWRPPTGSLFVTTAEPRPEGDLRVAVRQELTQPDSWFMLEIIARDNHLTVLIDGQKVVDYVDVDSTYRRGHIALQVYGINEPKTVVSCRKIEVKELLANPPWAGPSPAEPAEVPRTAADVLPFLAGTWKVEKAEVEPKPLADRARAVGHMTCDYLSGGKFLRQRGVFESGTVEPALQKPLEPGSDVPLVLYSYDPVNDVLFHWAAWPNGMTYGPVPGRFVPDSRSLLWLTTFPGGVQSTHQFNFVNINTITTRIYNQDAEAKILQEVHLTFARVKEPVTLPDKPADPTRPEEMTVLYQLVGEWRNEITVSVAGPDTKVETVRVKAEPILGGRFIEKFETNEATGASDYTLVWFDTDAKRYRSWFFNHTGSVTEFTGTWDEAAKTLTWNSPDGRLEGRWTFKSDDLSEYRHMVKDKDGTALNEAAGVSRRTGSATVAPLTDADVQRIAALPAAEQVEEVRKELVRRNPGFDGTVEHKIEDGAVTELRINIDKAMDISPIRVFNALRKLDLSGTHTDWRGNSQPWDLSPLKGTSFDRLTYLNLAYSKVTDAGLGPFKGCTKLVHLDLDDTRVSDVGMGSFANCKALTFLHIGDTRVGDRGLAHFRDCTGLTSLNLAHTMVGDAGMGHLRHCRNLETMNLTGTRIGDVGVELLGDCKGLRWLDLSGTSVGDTGLASLKDCTKLKLLSLVGTRVTDAGLDGLAGLDVLAELNLVNTKGTARGVEGLAKALPKCKITWDGGVVGPK